MKNGSLIDSIKPLKTKNLKGLSATKISEQILKTQKRIMM